MHRTFIVMSPRWKGCLDVASALDGMGVAIQERAECRCVVFSSEAVLEKDRPLLPPPRAASACPRDCVLQRFSSAVGHSRAGSLPRIARRAVPRSLGRCSPVFL